MKAPSLLAVAALTLALSPHRASAACSSWSSLYDGELEGVCVCNETQCDSVGSDYKSLEAGQVGVYTTSKAGDRLTYKVVNIDESPVDDPTYSIDVTTQYQTVIGFGGGFTDSAAINVYKLSPKLQDMVIDQYFSETGLQYTLGRIPIGSTDFSTSEYSYNDVVDDFTMEHFSIDIDKSPELNKLPFIQRVLNMTSRPIKMFASSWAPPTWITKENRTIDCTMKGSPGEQYWKAMALYYSKFLDAYKKEGVNFWAITAQNEPAKHALVTPQWQTLRLTADEERDFIKLDLGPLMAKNYPELKIIAGDDQKPGIFDRAEPFEDPDTRKFISGLGIHWYRNLDFIFGGGDFSKLKDFHDQYPDIFILGTEACEGYLPSLLGTGKGPSLENPKKAWKRAENYGRDIIEDMNNMAAGWTDWNLVLDTEGGPNWAKNMVDAPILIDEQNGAEFYKQPIFYIMGHFSKFLPPDSKRIEFPKTETLDDFHRCAFVTPDNQIVMQFLNRDSSEVTVSVKQTDENTFTLVLPAHSMQTVGVYTTSQSGERLEYKAIKVDAKPVSSPTFTIDVSTQYQTIIGFGGAFTDAVAINVYKLSPKLQDMVLDQYFSETGLQYNLARVPIGSNDFSTSIYSYNSVEGDLAMKHFSIDVDKAPNSHKIDLIQRILKSTSRDIKLFASSWAPPVWMTKQNSTINCSLKGTPGDKYWKALALYYSKFFDAYSEEGIDFWAMTVQNEPAKPLLAFAKWQTLRITAEEERDFIKLDLGPIMAKNHPDLKIIANDDQKPSLMRRLAPIEDPESLKYISGVATHWYQNIDFVLGGGDFDKLSEFHEEYPDLFILPTEACNGYMPGFLGTGKGPSLTDADTSWTRGENYGRDIIGDLNNFAAGWTDWNILLDTEGGPGWSENHIDAPILIDEENGAEFYKQPSFYYMGHYSKFIPAGSRRIELTALEDVDNDLESCAFVTPENQVVLVFMNRDRSEEVVSVLQPDSDTFTLKVPAHSIQTVILPASVDTSIHTLK
ncbi:hypothetical protein G195_009574 [Phytophthora kernoviae 00238/432]|uniref:Glycosyl hydrolase family 30 TIM-barrel domain-containing protein n=1 Tax=Phytophthora kernoviae 00238/432 TaxID=1284355 RepID=A0A8J4RXL8_9STRA|nr:hypothetical protein G195_009574 [Phytophthora kernoviae 00238/432]